MDFKFSEKEEKFRMEIRNFVKEEMPKGYMISVLDGEDSDEDWDLALSIVKKLGQRGWLTMNWPEEYGGMGASYFEMLVFAEEAGYWFIPSSIMMTGVGWAGPSLMKFGTEEQKKKYLPTFAAGDPDGVWCTAYSEPDAGSDFANIRTRAERRGDEYILNGQKVWTSGAHRIRWAWLAAKTDPNAKKKHHGISLFIVDMKSKGVTIRPINSYIGSHIFNEVFFDDVRIPAENLVGQENNGWYQLMHSLMYERGTLSLGAYGTTKRFFDELVHYVNETGLLRKPEVRQKMSDLAVDVEALKVLAYETVWKLSKEMLPIYEPSRDKISSDLVMERISIVGTEILGAYSQLDPLVRDSKWVRLRSFVEKNYWAFPGIAIAGATTDNQRNIVGQFGLGLPKSY